jgi:hypothetical protein
MTRWGGQHASLDFSAWLSDGHVPILSPTRYLTRGAPIEASNRNDWITRNEAVTDAIHAVAGDVGEGRASAGQTHAHCIEARIRAMQQDDAKLPGERTYAIQNVISLGISPET